MSLIAAIEKILVETAEERETQELVCNVLDELAAKSETKIDDAFARGVRAALLDELSPEDSK